MAIRLRFNELPQEVRRRLVAVLTASPVDPRVLAFELDGKRQAGLGCLKYLALIPAVGVTIGAAMEILGRAQKHALGSDPLAYVILAASLSALFAALATILYARIWPPPPYRQGRWAFPGSVVELTGGWVEITPNTAELGVPKVVTFKNSGTKTYRYTHVELAKGLTFSFSSDEAANATCDKILQGRAQVAEAVKTGSVAALVPLDPFAECTLSGKWSEPDVNPLAGPFVAVRPRLGYLGQWIAPVIVGVGLSVTLYFWVARTYLSAAAHG